MHVAGLSPWVAIACLTVVAIGSTLQGTIGIGMGLLASPILAIVDPDFLPVSVVLAVIPLGAGGAWRERAAVERRDVGTALLGRVVGVAAAAWAVTALGHRLVVVVVGLSVLVAVVGSITGSRFETTRRNLVIAGAASGFTGTTAGIGGPPMGLTYQHSSPDTMRATLAAFFAVGATMSFAGLVLAGAVDRHRIALALVVLPGVPIGLLCSKPLIGRLPAARVRPLVLVTCTLSALALLVDELA
ncbi:MAG: hypothetical protein RLZZ01_1834 [Actinomycetota bacterium]